MRVLLTRPRHVTSAAETGHLNELQVMKLHAVRLNALVYAVIRAAMHIQR